MGGISLAQREAMFAFGLHSNIPACCCLYFVDTWWPAVLSDKGGPEAVKAHAFEVERVIDKLGGGLQYVPCPSCLKAGIFQPLDKCHDSCPMLQVYHAEMAAAYE